MIHFELACVQQHAFDGWFRNGADFDNQVHNGLLSCPVCGSHAVGKTLMAPAVVSRSARVGTTGTASAVREALAAAEDVGDNFASEVRAMERDPDLKRSVYGRATAEEIRGLVDDGIEVYELPRELNLN